MYGRFSGQVEETGAMRLINAMKRMDWKHRLLFTALGVVISVLVLMFGITYSYFVKKLTVANERIVLNTFQESESRIDTILETADLCLSRLSNKAAVWDFSADNYENSLSRVISIRSVVQFMTEMLSLNDSIYGFGVWNGSGQCIASTSAKSRSGTTEVAPETAQLFEECRGNYPYVTWIMGEELRIGDGMPLSCLMDTSVIVGIKALGESDAYMEDSYLLIALSEASIREKFTMSVYNGSRTVLLDQDRTIISSTEEELLGDVYEPDSGCQNIEYALSSNGWMFVNMIPKNIYLREIRDIRNIWLILSILAAAGIILFFNVWTKRYTQPIQHLMESMELVGQENLEIVPTPGKGWPELVKLNAMFYQTVQKLKEYIRRVQKAEKDKAMEELRALQYQMNPHFLQNSLNSIRWMAMMTNNIKVADSLMILSKMIVPVFRNPSFTWKLRDEIGFLENYVAMMQIRFGNYMEYHTEYSPELLEEDFPRFILQPILENCFVHGSSIRELRQIWLRIRKADYLVIEVQNTGVFMDEAELDAVNCRIREGDCSGNSLGLANVRKRLEILYGERGQIWVDSGRERGVVTYIRF